MALFDEPLSPYYQLFSRGTLASFLSSRFSLGNSQEIDR